MSGKPMPAWWSVSMGVTLMILILSFSRQHREP